jgi:hypothetical protein
VCGVSETLENIAPEFDAPGQQLIWGVGQTGERNCIDADARTTRKNVHSNNCACVPLLEVKGKCKERRYRG